MPPTTTPMPPGGAPLQRIVSRLLPAGLRRRIRAARNRDTLRAHFTFEANGTTGYCYIRKNACSAVRNLIIETSPHARGSEEQAITFLSRCHRLARGDVADCARLIFVIRDPLERAASGYLQQIVMRLHEPYPELAESVEALTGRPRAALSFVDFVTAYLGTQDFGRINVHFMPQVSHLAPLVYTHVLQIRTLAADAGEVFGQAIAKRYFTQPVNDVARISIDPLPDSWRQPAAVLRRHFDERGSLPRKADLLTPETAEPLAAIYQADVALYDRYTAMRAEDPARVPRLDMRGHDFSAHFSVNAGTSAP